jgi:hypothetical protein
MLSSDSRAPRGLPGRLTRSLPFRTPTTPRESAALGVFFTPSMRISSASPGTSFSITARVASGVTSLGPSPVPPEVKTASQSSRSVKVSRRRRIWSRSSGRTSGAITTQPRASSNSRTAGPERSSRCPLAAASLSTRILARSGGGIGEGKVALSCCGIRRPSIAGLAAQAARLPIGFVQQPQSFHHQRLSGHRNRIFG